MDSSSNPQHDSDGDVHMFPEWLKPLLGDVHFISEAKAKISKHSEKLGIAGWHIDAELRRRRQKLEVKILTILKAFDSQIEHGNWVKFIEFSGAGHATLEPHITELYEQMHAITEEYRKYIDFLTCTKNMTREFDAQSATLCSALDHMKFTEKYRHDSHDYYSEDAYAKKFMRQHMKWDGWK